MNKQPRWRVVALALGLGLALAHPGTATRPAWADCGDGSAPCAETSNRLPATIIAPPAIVLPDQVAPEAEDELLTGARGLARPDVNGPEASGTGADASDKAGGAGAVSASPMDAIVGAVAP